MLSAQSQLSLVVCDFKAAAHGFDIQDAAEQLGKAHIQGQVKLSDGIGHLSFHGVVRRDDERSHPYKRHDEELQDGTTSLSLQPLLLAT